MCVTPQGDGQTGRHGKKWHLKANGNLYGNRGASATASFRGEREEVVWCAPLRWKHEDGLARWVANGFFKGENDDNIFLPCCILIENSCAVCVGMIKYEAEHNLFKSWSHVWCENSKPALE